MILRAHDLLDIKPFVYPSISILHKPSYAKLTACPLKDLAATGYIESVTPRES